MSENEKKTGSWKMIAGCVLLIVVLFVGVKLAFWGLGQAIPQNHPSASQSASASLDAPAASQEETEGPSFCIYCGRELPESFEWGQFCPWCGKKME